MKWEVQLTILCMLQKTSLLHCQRDVTAPERRHWQRHTHKHTETDKKCHEGCSSEITIFVSRDDFSVTEDSKKRKRHKGMQKGG